MEVYEQILGGRMFHFFYRHIRASRCRHVDQERGVNHLTCGFHPWDAVIDILPFLQASRQIFDESVVVLYRTNCFSFTTRSAYIDFFQSVPIPFQREVRHIHLDIHFFIPGQEAFNNRQPGDVYRLIEAACAPAVAHRLSLTGEIFEHEDFQYLRPGPAQLNDPIRTLDNYILHFLRNISAYAYACVQDDVYVDIRGLEYFPPTSENFSIFNQPYQNTFFHQQDANQRLSRYVRRLLLQEVPRFEDWSGNLPEGYLLE